MKRLSLTFFALIFSFGLLASLEAPSALAAETLVLDTSNGTFSSWNQNAGAIYLNKITGVSGSVITTIKSGWAYNVTTQASTNTVYIFNDVSGAPGTVAATFTYSSNDGAAWAAYTGSYTVPAGGTFFIGQRASSSISNAGGATANQAGTSWSIYYGNRYSGTTLTGPFSQDPVNSAPVWRIYATSLTTLGTPAIPVTSVTSSSISVNETTTVVNASSYLVKLYQSDGVTLVDSVTATNSTILTGITFSGLTRNTQYKVGVIAVGDQISYGNSAQSSLVSVLTLPTQTSTSLNISGAPSTLTFRSSYQLVATVTGTTGYVSFKANGKVAPGCARVLVSGGTATCNWKAAIHGAISISASFTSTNASYTSSQSGTISISGQLRTNKR
jgi:hypothetical protein